MICTRNRPAHLKRCLGSIRRSSLPPDTEIVLVDNSDDEKMRENKKVSDYYKCVYVRESTAGLSRARNKGIRNATKRYIVFVDDDFVCDKMWIKHLLNNFGNDREVSCCTGRVISYLHDEPSSTFEQFLSFDKGTSRREFDSRDISLVKMMRIAIEAMVKIIKSQRIENRPIPLAVGTSYCCLKREVFDEVDRLMIDETLGIGTSARGGEDLDLLYRILKCGHKIVYDPRSIVFHVHRSSISKVYVQSYDYGIGLRSWMVRYIRKDPYVLAFFFGAFLYLFLSYIRLSLTSGKPRPLVLYLLLGFIRGG